MVAANQDQRRSAVRTALIFVQVLSPFAASRDERLRSVRSSPDYQAAAGLF
jgi:hypothetical protein